MLDKRQFYINGNWQPPKGDEDLMVIDPSNEEQFAVIALGSQSDTDAAVAAARAAFSPWAQTPVAERLALLETLASIYEMRYEQMGVIISREMGAPITMAKEAQAWVGCQHFSSFIKTVKSFSFKSFQDETLILYEPIGVCALITPWNWPISQIALKVIPALAAGCTMVLKPSEIAPLSAMLFAEMVHEAGFPAGVFNLVNGDGAGVGSQLASHDDVDMVSFTGSTRAGRDITRNSATNIKRVSLELGGKGANVIFSDADEQAVERGVRRCFNNSGQSCNAPSRMIVERSMYDDALAIAELVAKDIKVDVASKEGNHIGPLVSRVQFDKVQKLIEQGISEGARLIHGGLGLPEGLNNGYFVRPTVFADVRKDMTIAREEIFGPVISIIPFDNEAEALNIANDTVYGLTNYIQTGNAERAARFARDMRSGMVEINGKSLVSDAPFGGYRQSGNGREGGAWGLKEFLEVKAVSGWESYT